VAAIPSEFIPIAIFTALLWVQDLQVVAVATCAPLGTGGGGGSMRSSRYTGGGGGSMRSSRYTGGGGGNMRSSRYTGGGGGSMLETCSTSLVNNDCNHSQACTLGGRRILEPMALFAYLIIRTF
jgi:hypothetical protein